MRFKKALSVALALILTLSPIGCQNAENPQSGEEGSVTENTDGRDYITLLYSAADTFNPFNTKTDINRRLCSLLYDSLVKLDNEFNPVYVLASEVKNEDKKCIVTIKDTVFSDGSAVTAEDVVYSFNLAKGETSVYAGELNIALSAKAAGSRTVEFTLSRRDPYFLNLLDFPILKRGSENVKDSDSVLQPPIGSGRYVVNSERNGLEQNPLYAGNKGSIKTVRLINAPDSESVSHYVEVGAADMYFSEISDGSIIRMSGKKLDINLNNLVYIGINKNYGALGENALRQALSSGLDREKICKDAFYNNAVAANGFYNPVWQEVKSVQNIQTAANEKITVENLGKIGYNKLDSNGLRKNAGGGSLSFTMLVNSENRLRVEAARLISKQLSSFGIQITVVEKDYEQYKLSLESGSFELYLGEVKLTDNMDIYPLVAEDGTMAFGNKIPDAVAEGVQETEAINKASQVITQFYEGQATISDVAVVLQSEMPIIPVCYRTGALFCNDNIENIENSSFSDIYFSIEAYKYND